MIDADRITRLVDEVTPEAVSLRHAIHRNPELAMEEHDTAALVRRSLAESGLEPLPPVLGTDVIALMPCGGAGRNVTLRADMDALPLQENADVPHRSARDGVMHACGHDGHTAVLLGAAAALARLREELAGTVRFVFQPAEEVRAAGRDLVRRGILEDPPAEAVFALHSMSGLPVGAISSKPGVFLGAADFFTLRVEGRGAHGSRPEESVDPVLTAARVVEGLQSIVSRRVSPLDSAVVSVCRIQGGTNGNVIPDSVELEGTTRYLNLETGRKLPGWIEQIAAGVCASAGASHVLDYSDSYIPTVNDAEMVKLGREVVADVLGPGSWVEMSEPAAAAEDFSYYLQEHPGAMFWLGMGEECAPLHNARFDFNDEAVRNGILFLVCAAVTFLSRSTDRDL